MVLKSSCPSQIFYAVVVPDAIEVVYFSLVLGVGNECICYEAVDSMLGDNAVHTYCYTFVTSRACPRFQHLLTTPHFTCTADLVCGVRSNHTPLHYSYQSVGVMGFVFNLTYYK